MSTVLLLLQLRESINYKQIVIATTARPLLFQHPADPTSGRQFRKIESRFPGSLLSHIDHPINTDEKPINTYEK